MKLTPIINPVALRLDTTVGTRIFSGTTMIHGDTGWRNIQSLKAHPDLDVRRATLRRENSTISWDFDIGVPAGVDLTSLFVGIPAEFLPPSFVYATPGYIATTKNMSAPASQMMPDGSRPWLIAPSGGVAGTTDPRTAQIGWCTGTSPRWTGVTTIRWSGIQTTNRSWPTILPGLPV